MDNQSIRSLKKMAKSKQKAQNDGKPIPVGIDDVGDDLLQNILNRLPALSFASAACVSRSWNSICRHILSSPKLSSAVSLNQSLENAVIEVVDKVLSEPIRPHFALASIGPSYCLQQAHQMIAEKLGSRVPVITNVAEGIIGRHSRTDNLVEVQWEVTEEEGSIEEVHRAVLPVENVNRGIILTVGFLPGLKTHVVPLHSQDTGFRKFLDDEFVMDIREYIAAVSDSTSPACIMLFADQTTDIKPVLQKMEFAFSSDTAIVGDGSSQFLYRSSSTGTSVLRTESTCAVALVFGKDRNKSPGIGEMKFNVVLSTGLSPLGLTYKTTAVKCYPTMTCLTASRGTMHEYLDGQTLLEDIYDELGDRIQYPAFYIGVTKRRKCSVGTERVRRMQFLEFHEVTGGNEEYLFVNSVNIKTGDPFRFYISDSKAALSSCNTIADNLRQLKQDFEARHEHVTGVPSSVGRRGVFGGIIFSCCGRGNTFFGHPGIDSSPFVGNFPGVTFGGTYCAGEIGRGNSNLYDEENEEGDLISCNYHAFSAVYLVMSYCPPPQID